MRAGSKTAYRQIAANWDSLLHEKGSGELQFASELFGLFDSFGTAPALLAALEDSSRTSDARAKLAGDVLAGNVTGEVRDLVMGVVRERWSESGDLRQALELLAVQTLLAGAERTGELAQVESELYDFRGALNNERELRRALRDDFYPLPAREELLDSVLPEVSAYTKALLHRALAKVPASSLAATLSEYLTMTAERGQHLVASVTAALPLTSAQEERLANVLSKKFGAPVRIHTTIDTAVIGGIRVHVGDYVIDGTLASRLATIKEVFGNGR